MLARGWVCGTEFLDERMPRYGARIFELRRRGCLIVSRTCGNPQHRHVSKHQDEWRLLAAPDAAGQIVGVPV
jgi:hypothetical protein